MYVCNYVGIFCISHVFHRKTREKSKLAKQTYCLLLQVTPCEHCVRVFDAVRVYIYTRNRTSTCIQAHAYLFSSGLRWSYLAEWYICGTQKLYTRNTRTAGYCCICPCVDFCMHVSVQVSALLCMHVHAMGRLYANGLLSSMPAHLACLVRLVRNCERECVCAFV
jgi:hypothetical protein